MAIESPFTFAMRIVRQEAGRQTVVMLPGAGATVSVWARQIRAFSQCFNLALVDFPGHYLRQRQRQATRPCAEQEYTFAGLVDSLAQGLAGAGLTRYHLVALSLGTILGRALVARHPHHVLSAVYAGTIAELAPLPYALMKTGQHIRHALPYMLLYRMYAWSIMPGPNHWATRRLFYRDARALGRAEFNRWFALTDAVVPLLKELWNQPSPVPALHVMGEHDYMFRRSAEKLAVAEGSAFAIVPRVGHVCSVEAPAAFNAVALEFMRGHARRPDRAQ